MIEETCLFDETVQFIRNCKHCHSAASCGRGIFWSLPCCWLGYTSICPQLHTCPLWNTSCASNTLLRRCGSLGDSNLRTLCQMQIGATKMASLLHCLQGCDSSTPSNKDCSLQLPRALSKLHGLHHQHCHPIKGLLSLLLTHHFLVMDVDCCLTCTSVIPMIIWFVVLALGLFKSPSHICDRLTDGLPHALSSALLLFHACPWKHLPQSLHSFSSEGPTPSLSAG